MPPLEVFTLAGLGGLEESEGDPRPESYLQNKNTVIYRGRVAVRAPVFGIVNVVNSTGGDVDAILGMTVYLGKVYIAGYDDSLNEVNLVEVEFDGTGMIHRAVIWTSATVQPTAVIMQSFTAGTATSSEDRLYISDFDQTFRTRFWNGTVMTDLEIDFDLNATAEDVHFSFIKEFAFHLWGVGFIQGATTRPEYLRFSTPGAIPLTDIADGTDRDWHIADHLEIGRRGNPIIGLDVVNGRLLIYQQDAIHAISGYSRDTWAVQTVNPYIGAVGPFAFDTYAGKMAFFWSATGPMMTDGTQVIDIGESIRKSVNEVPSDTNIVTVVDPTTMIAYFIVPTEGSSFPNFYYAFDIQHQRWTSGQFLSGAGAAININVGSRIVELGSAAAGPAAAPSSLTAVVKSDNEDFGMDLDWVNGDTAVNTVTEIHRDTTVSFTMGPSTLQDTVGSGVTHYEATVAANTQFYFKVRHVRNGQNSAGSNEPTATSHYARQSPVTQSSLVNGLRVHTTNSTTNAEIDIERQTEGNSTWDAVITLNNQSVGAKTHNDTTTTCGTSYRYRTRTHESTVRPSPWVETGTQFLEACSGGPAISNFTATNSQPNPLKPWLRTTVLTWDRTNWTPGDRVRIYVADPTTSSFILKATVSGQSWTDPNARICAGADLVDYKGETWDENTTLSETDTIIAHDPCDLGA